MHKFIRNIFPVGKGGFALESIDDYSIVYDCGSTTSPARVSNYISWISSYINKVNRLYISHFDKDHVNGIRELLSAVRVYSAIIPYIPPKYRTAYDSATGGAYHSIHRLLSEYQVESQELTDEDSQNNHIWEWVSMPMLKDSDWDDLDTEFSKKKLDTHRLNDASYVDFKKDEINSCFKAAFGPKGPNSKGLIMLSQKVSGYIEFNKMFRNWEETTLSDETAALYLGDSHVKGEDAQTVRSFLNLHLRGPLLFNQIPHHGSQHSSGVNFNTDFPAKYYYYQDSSSNRLQKNVRLYNALSVSSSLLEVRDVDSDRIHHIVKIR